MNAPRWKIWSICAKSLLKRLSTMANNPLPQMMTPNNQRPNRMQQNHVIRPISPADYDQLRALYKYSLSKNTAGFVQNPDFHGDIAARAEQYQNNNGAM